MERIWYESQAVSIHSVTHFNCHECQIKKQKDKHAPWRWLLPARLGKIADNWAETKHKCHVLLQFLPLAFSLIRVLWRILRWNETQYMHKIISAQVELAFSVEKEYLFFLIGFQSGKELLALIEVELKVAKLVRCCRQKWHKWLIDETENCKAYVNKWCQHRSSNV